MQMLHQTIAPAAAATDNILGGLALARLKTKRLGALERMACVALDMLQRKGCKLHDA